MFDVRFHVRIHTAPHGSSSYDPVLQYDTQIPFAPSLDIGYKLLGEENWVDAEEITWRQDLNRFHVWCSPHKEFARQQKTNELAPDTLWKMVDELVVVYEQRGWILNNDPLPLRKHRQSG